MPYMHLYLDQIDLNKNDVHVLYWDRDNEPDAEYDEKIHYHVFRKYMLDSNPLSKKLAHIMAYGHFARKTINQTKPDLLIVLHSTTAVTIRSLLVKEYKNKYIFDFRDLTYEKFKFYQKAIGTIVNNSYITFTSSDGFRFVLPESDKVVTSHNIMNNALELHNQMDVRKPHKKDHYVTAFWGLIRGYDINKNLITKLCDNGHFDVHYYGRAQGKMLELMNEMSEAYDSFHFHGVYSPKDTLDFARNTDLLINIYENKGTMRHAMANKYYDGIVYRVPQLCNVGTFMGKRCEDKGVGKACNPYDENFAEEVIKYYDSIDFEDFSYKCQEELIDVLDQVRIGKNIIKKIVSA